MVAKIFQVVSKQKGRSMLALGAEYVRGELNPRQKGMHRIGLWSEYTYRKRTELSQRVRAYSQ